MELYLFSGSHHVGKASVPQQQPHIEATPVKCCASQNAAVTTAMQAVNEKILWASEALNSSHSTGECQQLCELLKTCAETLRALQDIQR